MTISADLGPQLESFVSSLVASGRFHSPDAVLREAVLLFQQREEQFSRLDAAIKRGLADVEAGRVKPAKDVFDELEARFAVLAPVSDT